MPATRIMKARMSLGGKSVIRIVSVAFALALLSATPVNSADLILESSGGVPYCRFASQSPLIDIERAGELRKEVTQRFEQAVDVADSPSWIDSSRPAYTWASEAKVACGKAIGYLKGGYISEEYVGKCDCFHQRMVRYMR